MPYSLLVASIISMAGPSWAEVLVDRNVPGKPVPAESARQDPTDPVGEEEPESAPASELAGDGAGADQVLFEQLLVVGAPEEARRVPGSAHVITAADVERQEYTDIHRLLRQAPGLNIQEEDGYGLRPNIGIRGTGVERSQKITLLEDGVLAAPAPYSAPSAYYSPTAGRMEGFEIRKGSGAIRQGPHTNGGAINYLSSSIPSAFRARASVAAGAEDLVRARASIGSSTERLGWLVETFHFETEGFKRIDGSSVGDSGFDLEDTMAKLRYNSPSGAAIYQAIELKLGKTDQIGNETYLGLTQDDFDRTPLRRYAASDGDRITAEHEQFQLSYYLQTSDRWNLTATLYRNVFSRNWFKLENVNGLGVAGILDEPARFPDALAILRGESDSEPGALGVRNNRRDYFSEGLQLVLALDLAAGGVEHDVQIGLRVHRDQEDRYQEEDLYQMLDGRRLLTEKGLPGSNANRVADAEATALFVQDTLTVGRWTWTPGVRIEAIDLARADFGRRDPTRSGAHLALRENSLTEIIPGLGVGFDLDADSNLFFGVHRGFSPPSPGSAEEVEAEESINYELGWRYARGGTSAELVGFFNDYENLLGNDTVSSGGQGTGDQFNGGRVEVKGLEAAVAFDLAPASVRKVRLPVRLAYTYTAAEFKNSFESDFADWAPRVVRGDQLSYVPESQLYAALSVETDRWAAHLDGSWSDEMRTRPGTGPIPANLEIGSRMLLDLRLELRLADDVKIWGQVLNVGDEIYVAARRPAGLRPGRPRALLFGLALNLDRDAGER